MPALVAKFHGIPTPERELIQKPLQSWFVGTEVGRELEQDRPKPTGQSPSPDEEPPNRAAAQAQPLDVGNVPAGLDANVNEPVTAADH
jgi:hypothetical protein